MKLYVLFDKYYGEDIPMGFTTNKKIIEEIKAKYPTCSIKIYDNIEQEEYIEFPDFSL